MSPKPDGATRNRSDKPKFTPAHEIVSDEVMREALGVQDAAMINGRLNDLGDLLWYNGQMDRKEKERQLVQAIELFNSLKPEDGVEGMLAKQMVGTHSAAMECLRLAAAPTQSFEVSDMALRHAHRLMTLYARQVETLDKHRSKGQHKVVVEHVHAAEGDQVILSPVGGTGNRGVAANAPDHESKSETLVPLKFPDRQMARRKKLP